MTDYISIPLYRKVGCGEIHCSFLEQDGAFHKLQIQTVFLRSNYTERDDATGEKCLVMPCDQSWFDIIARLLTYCIRRGLWEGNVMQGIVKQLKNPAGKCLRYCVNKEHITSCGDAIGRMVEEYMKMKEGEIAVPTEKI